MSRANRKKAVFSPNAKDSFTNELQSLDILLEGGTNCLDILAQYGMINKSSVQNIRDDMRKKAIKARHPYEIYQGKNDKRWFTYVPDDTKKDGRRKIARKDEKALYEFLYDFYYGEADYYKNCCLMEIYPEWLKYKLATANRSNTVHRIDSDYKRYYLNEPLSKKILTTPLAKLTKADIKQWAYTLIKHYQLSKKQYYNLSTVLRQVYEYLIDKDIFETNTCALVKVDSNIFRKTPKKKAETQIFFEDEVKAIIKRARELAEETKDESYLSIPLFFLTGMRIGEVLGLSYEDIDEDSQTIYLHRSLVVDDTLNENGTWEKRKFILVDYLKANAEPREVLAPDLCFEIVKDVKRLQESRKTESELLFPVNTPSNVEFKLYRICRQLDIMRRSPHKGRKTYISSLLNKGTDLDFVRSQVGHRDLSTTLNNYTYSTTRKEQQIEQLNSILAS